MVEDQSHEYPPGDQQVERVKNSHRILAGRIVFVCFIKQCFFTLKEILFLICIVPNPNGTNHMKHSQDQGI